MFVFAVEHVIQPGKTLVWILLGPMSGLSEDLASLEFEAGRRLGRAAAAWRGSGRSQHGSRLLVRPPIAGAAERS